MSANQIFAPNFDNCGAQSLDTKWLLIFPFLHKLSWGLWKSGVRYCGSLENDTDSNLLRLFLGLPRV